jgi:hypothetical protein
MLGNWDILQNQKKKEENKQEGNTEERAKEKATKRQGGKSTPGLPITYEFITSNIIFVEK